MQENIAQAQMLMDAFAARTGLTGGAQRRYLWTDAFAVCNFLGLRVATGDARYDDLASGLIRSVHDVLGKQRPDAAKSGWLSGLSDNDGQAHPTLAGLRI